MIWYCIICERFKCHQRIKLTTPDKNIEKWTVLTEYGLATVMPSSSAYISTHNMERNGACINKFSCKGQKQIGVFLVWQQQKYHTNCCQSVNKKELYNTRVEIGEPDSSKTFISAMCTTVHYGKWTLSWQVHHLASVHFWQVLFVAMCWMRIVDCTLYIGHWLCCIWCPACADLPVCGRVACCSSIMCSWVMMLCKFSCTMCLCKSSYLWAMQVLV